MKLRIMQLEERVVLEGSGIDHDDAPDDASADVAVLTAMSNVDTAVIDDPDGEGDSAEAIADGASLPVDYVPYDGNAETSSAEATEGTRLLVVSSRVQQADALAAAADDDVQTLTYDPTVTSLDQLLNDMRMTLGGAQADSIGFAVHGSEGQFSLVDGQTTSLLSVLASDTQQDFWRGVGDLVQNDGRIDILSCDLAETEAGQLLVGEMEHLTGRNVAASDDTTGNEAYGGDWVLETDNVNAESAYFDSLALTGFTGRLASVLSIDDLDGSVDVDETGPTNDTFTVVLSNQAPTDTVTVTLIEPAGVTLDVTTLTFTVGDWNTPQTVTVTAVDDAIDEGAHTATVDMSATSTDGAYDGETASVTVNITDNDVGTSGITVNDGGGVSVDEANSGTADTFTMVLDSEPTGDVVISFTNDNGDVQAIGDITFTSANWSTVQIVDVYATDDSLDEGGAHSDTINWTAASADGNYDALSSTVAVSVADDDIAGISVNDGGGVSVDEATPGTAGTFTMALDSEPTGDVVISFTNDNGDVQAIGDITFTSANWSAAQTVNVYAADDSLNEANPHSDTITWTAASADGDYDALSNTVSVSVADDDTPGVTVNDGGGVSVDEATPGTADTFTMVLDSEPTGNVVISFANDNGDVQAIGDITFTPGNWDTPQTVDVYATDDSLDEANPHSDTITWTAASADGDYDALSSTVAVSIADDDAAGVTISSVPASVDESGETSDTYSVVLDSEPAADVTVTIGGAGGQVTHTASLTFTSANWDTAQTVTVTAVDDTLDEADPHTVNLSHMVSSADANYNGLAAPPAAVDIADNDDAGVTISSVPVSVDETGETSDTYSVVLDSQPTNDVIVTVGGAGGQVTHTASLTFTSGNWNTPQNVTVTAVDDLVDENDPHTVNLTHTVSSADANYNGLAAPTAAVDIADNDDAGVTVVESGGSTAVSENTPGTADTFTMVLDTQPTADVTISFTNAGGDVAAIGNITFTSANWNVAQTVNVYAVDDSEDEGASETVAIAWSAASTDGFYNGKNSTVSVNIADNDSAGLIITGSPSVAEGGATDTYTVALQSAPTGNVTVTIANPTSDGELTVDTTTLTFTSGNWNTPQTVTVTAVDDATYEGPAATHTGVIVHDISSGSDSIYNGLSDENLNVTISDNDPNAVDDPGAGTWSVSENGGTYNLNVLANDGGAGTLTIDQLDTATHSTKGLVTINAGTSIQYSPNGQFENLAAGDTATDQFIYRINNGMGGQDTATVTMTIVGQNDTPTPQNDSDTTDEDTVLNVAAAGVLANDTDPDDGESATLQVSSHDATSAQGATVTVNADGSFSYDPTAASALQKLAQGESTVDTFSYTVQDVNGATANATVSITVNGVNDNPTAVNDSGYSTNEETTLNVAAGSGVLANDTDTDTSDIAGLVAQTQTNVATTKDGRVTVNADGSFSYDPSGSATLQTLAQGVTTTDTFTYTLDDTNGGTDTATVTINVTGVNDAPTSADNAVTTGEDVPYVFQVSNFNYSDIDVGDTMAYVRITALPVKGQLMLNGTPITVPQYISAANIASGNLQYQNAANEFGAGYTTFSFQVRDAWGAESGAQTMTVNVNGLNDAPDVSPSTGLLNYDEGSGAVPLDDLLVLTDIENDKTDWVTIKIASNYVKGQDYLLFDFDAGDLIHATWDSATGTLDLFTSDASFQNMSVFQDAIRRVEYQNTSGTPSTATRDVTISVEDNNASFGGGGAGGGKQTGTGLIQIHVKEDVLVNQDTELESAPPPDPADYFFEEDGGLGEGEPGVDAGAADAGATGGDTGGDSGQTDATDTDQDQQTTDDDYAFEDNDDGNQDAGQGDGDIAAQIADIEASTLESIKQAENVLENAGQVEATLLDGTPLAEHPLLAAYIQEHETLQSEIDTLIDQLRAELTDMQETDGEIEGLQTDILASRQRILDTAVTRLEILNRFFGRAQTILSENPGLTEAELRELLEEELALITKAVKSERSTEVGQIMQDAAAALLKEKSGNGSNGNSQGENGNNGGEPSGESGNGNEDSAPSGDAETPDAGEDAA